MDAATGVRGYRTAAGVVGLLAVYWVLCVSAVRTKSATYDEGTYLAGGYSYWTRNDYRLNAESGHLPQRVAALPLLLTDPSFPGRDHLGWRWGDALSVGRSFLNEADHHPDAVLLPTRMACATLSALVGLLVFAWSRRLFGTAGGFVSLGLFAFCPTMLANGPVVQSDMAAALFFSAAVAGMWATLHRLTPLRVLASCGAFAGLFLSKLSAPVVVVIGLVLIAVRVADGRPLPVAFGPGGVVRGRWRLAATAVALVGLHAVVVWAAVWAAYGFRFSAHNPADGTPSYSMRSAILRYTGHPQTALARPLLKLAHDHRVLPEAYLFGVAFQVYHTSPAAERFGFLGGEAYTGGRFLYFPYCFLTKTPLPLFGLLGLAVGGWWRFRRTPGAATLYDLAPVLALLAVYALVTVRTPVNIGHRYLAPLYPPLLVLAGAAALWFRPGVRRWPGVGVAVLLAAYAAGSLAAWPHYLAYFNPIDGGPRTAYRRLVDSSLDWGQDLPELRRWLDERGLPSGETPVYLGYFGTAGVERNGVRAVPLYTYPHQPMSLRCESLAGGVYCVSATLLADGYVNDAGSPGELGADRFARLCAYLRTRTPDDSIGYSILVFRLTDAEVNAALR